MAEESKKAKGPMVKNNHKGALLIAGVVVPAGKSVEVPDVDKKNAVIKKWIESKVITVS